MCVQFFSIYSGPGGSGIYIPASTKSCLHQHEYVNASSKNLEHVLPTRPPKVN